MAARALLRVRIARQQLSGCTILTSKTDLSGDTIVCVASAESVAPAGTVVSVAGPFPDVRAFASVSSIKMLVCPHIWLSSNVGDEGSACCCGVPGRCAIIMLGGVSSVFDDIFSSNTCEHCM